VKSVTQNGIYREEAEEVEVKIQQRWQ